MKPTIGLEIHAELLTKSKLFCGCKNDPNAKEPNIHICPICMGYPGALPFINKKAIQSLVRVGTAVGGKIADFTEFDRKHYFYPDIPKGYQISQYENPIVSGGSINGIDIERIHLEEDTAKSNHETSDGSTLIDFNRSGVPLMELVTKPDLTSAEEAVSFAEELQLIIRYLNVSNARMECGEMRVEANISMGEKKCSGTKVEVKNLNSLKSVKGAINYEIERQTELLERKDKVVQETRGWDENKCNTFSQRSKETSGEYRYFPEPNLTKFKITELDGCSKDQIKDSIPEMPNQKRKRYKRYSLNHDQIETLIKSRGLYELFDTCCKYKNKNLKLIANYLTSDVVGELVENEKADISNLTSDSLCEISDMLDTNSISSRGAKNILKIILEVGGCPKDIAEKENLFQKSDEGDLLEIVEKVIKENPGVVEEYKEGKEKAIKFLIGSGMKETKGAANPQTLEKLLRKSIK